MVEIVKEATWLEWAEDSAQVFEKDGCAPFTANVLCQALLFAGQYIQLNSAMIHSAKRVSLFAGFMEDSFDLLALPHAAYKFLQAAYSLDITETIQNGCAITYCLAAVVSVLDALGLLYLGDIRSLVQVMTCSSLLVSDTITLMIQIKSWVTLGKTQTKKGELKRALCALAYTITSVAYYMIQFVAATLFSVSGGLAATCLPIVLLQLARMVFRVAARYFEIANIRDAVSFSA